jgi:hypothetical protein
MSTAFVPTSEAAILSRVLQQDNNDLSPEAARIILRWEFPAEDRRRMHALLQKGQKGKMSATEQDAMENYRRVGYLLDIMRSKARLALKKSARL